MAEKEIKTKIDFDWNSLIDKDIFAEKGIAVTKKQYSQLIDDANIELDKFKKENPDIYVKYFFSPISNEFSIWNLDDLHQTEQNICQNFLNLINDLAEYHLKDI